MSCLTDVTQVADARGDPVRSGGGASEGVENGVCVGAPSDMKTFDLAC